MQLKSFLSQYGSHKLKFILEKYTKIVCSVLVFAPKINLLGKVEYSKFKVKQRLLTKSRVISFLIKGGPKKHLPMKLKSFLSQYGNQKVNFILEKYTKIVCTMLILAKNRLFGKSGIFKNSELSNVC